MIGFNELETQKKLGLKPGSELVALRLVRATVSGDQYALEISVAVPDGTPAPDGTNTSKIEIHYRLLDI